MKIRRICKDVWRKIRKTLQQFCIKCMFLSNCTSKDLHKKILFLTPLPPAKTGTAAYAFEVYKNLFPNLDFCSDISKVKDYKYILKEIGKNKSQVIPLFLLNEIKQKYDTVFANLGNSYFHLGYLEYCIQNFGAENIYCVLCETQLSGLMLAYCAKHKIDFGDLLLKYYPEKEKLKEVVRLGTYNDLAHYGVFCIRILMGLTGVRKFVLYREIGKKQILEDVGSFEGLEINVIPSPLRKINYEVRPAKVATEGYLIGSFGIAHDAKQTDKVINAINLLNEKGVKVKLLLAGYSVTKYCHSYKQDNLIMIENPRYDELLSLMKRVDAAVQLRKLSNGEASGCICELISLNKKIIASEILVDNNIKNCCNVVSKDCSVEELAEVIETILKDEASRDFSDVVAKYTFVNTAQALMGLVK